MGEIRVRWQLTVALLTIMAIENVQLQELVQSVNNTDTVDLQAIAMLKALRVDHLDHTFTDIESYRTVHMFLNLTVDMDQETAQGFVELTYVKMKLASRGSDGNLMDHGLVLDLGAQVTVFGVEDLVSGNNVPYQVYCDRQQTTVLKCALVLERISDAVGRGIVRIYYGTDANSSSLHFIQPSMTLENKTKFLVSVTQPSDARGWIPCQDTPSIKHPYDAEIRVTSPYKVLMSATSQPVDPATESGWQTYRFKQKHPVPPFLIAITVADVESVDLQHGDEEEGAEDRTRIKLDMMDSPCSNCTITEEDWDIDAVETGELHRRVVPIRVWGEREFMKKLEASGKLNMVTEMMKICQDALFSYPWDRYDIVIAPPGYVFQGMEYPGMNYISVSLLKIGDLSGPEYSFAELIAHEMVHSWLGNLVTPKYAGNVWLAEGITSFLGYRVVAQYYNDTEVGKFIRREKFASLKKMATDGGSSVLSPDLYDKHPFLGFTYVIYIKGALFMEYLVHQTNIETVYTTLKIYLSRYRYQSVDTEDFLHVLFQTAENLNGGQASLSEAMIFRWLERPTTKIPLTLYPSDIYDECDMIYKVLANHSWKSVHVSTADIAGAYKNKENKYLRRQMMIVLDRMDTTTSRMRQNTQNHNKWNNLVNKLDRLFGFSQLSKDDPSMFAVWAQLALKFNHTATAAHAVDFIRQHGRTELLFKVLSGSAGDLRGELATVLEEEYDLGSYPSFVGRMLGFYVSYFLV